MNETSASENNLRIVSLYSTILVLIISGAALLGWMFDIPILASGAKSYFPMVPSTAILFMIISGALIINLRLPDRHIARPVVLVSALFVTLVSLVILADYLSVAFHPDIEGLLPFKAKMFASVKTGRMSPINAANFIAAGLSLLLSAISPLNNQRTRRASTLLAVAVSAVGGVMILGYLHGSPLLYGGSITPVSMPSAFAFFALGIGLVSASGDDSSLNRLFFGDSVYSRLMRAFFPVTAAIVIIHGILGARLFSNITNPALKSSLLTLLSLSIVGIIITAISRKIGNIIDTAEALRSQALEELRLAKEELEVRVRERTEELSCALHDLQAETEKRLHAVEELRSKEQMLMQQSRLAAMGDMLVNISHQWRQPLNVLGIKVQELGLIYKYGGFSEELLDGNIADAMKIIQRMSQTINDFLNFLEPNKEKIPFRVDQAIRKAVDLVEENFRNNNIRIEIRSQGDLQVNGFPNEFSQAVLNLLMNAKDAFLECGATDAKITVLSWVENNRAVVTVTDNAGGIEEKFLDKIFDAFFTTKVLGKGAGVGLFISKIIIENNMGGRLTVRNVEGGAEFRIEV